MKEEQIKEINDLLLAYSAGDYTVKGKISEEVDEIDMIISGINMLGEELESTNVSRDYFSSIYNAVTDLVFIVDLDGSVKEINQAVTDLLKFSPDELVKNQLSIVFKDKDIFKKIKDRLDQKNQKSYSLEKTLLSKNKEAILVLITSSKIIDRYGSFKGYLISVKDITQQKQTEKLILQTVVSTQQKEQKRVADDLHDSLGQELSMAKLMISNLESLKIENEDHIHLVKTCKDILDSSIKQLRSICFDLMPSVLIKGGLYLALEELINTLNRQKLITFNFKAIENIPRLDSDIEIVSFRVIQEFINNTIKHSEAKEVNIEFFETKDNYIRILIKDNGKGFDTKSLDLKHDGRGLNNMKSRILAFNGKFKLSSKINEGTRLDLRLPTKKQI